MIDSDTSARPSSSRIDFLVALTVLLVVPASAQSPILVSPASLSGTLGAATTSTQTLSVTNTGATSLTVVAARGPASAPSGGPDAAGYTWTDSDHPGGPVYAWTDIRATGTHHPLSSIGDVWVDLPFAFEFYGQSYTRVKVYADGLISFLPTYQGSTSNNRPIPYWDHPDLFIAGFWEDLDPSRAGGVYTGADARGRFVVQYHEVGLAGSSAPEARYTFQIVLDATGTIVIQYGPMNGPTTSATVGIENATSVHGGSTTGLQVAYNAPYVRDGLAVRIAQGDPWAWTPGAPFVLAPGASADLPVTFASHELSAGTYASSLVLTTGEPSVAPVMVPTTLTVLSEPDVAVSATALDFGEVFAGVLREDTLWVTNTGSAALTVASVGTDGAPFSAVLDGASTLAPGDRRIVRVAFAPTSGGSFAGTLALDTDDPDTPTVEVALAGSSLLPPTLAVTPATLDLALDVGETTSATVTLANTGASDLDATLAFRHPGGGVLDSLFYDFGSPTAGTTGWSPWLPFAVSNRFTADGRFHLTTIGAYLHIERDPTVRFEVYGAGTFGDPTSGPLLWSRDVAVPHGPAAMVRVPLDTTLTFEDSEDFYLVIWTEGEFAPFGTHHSNGGRSYRRTFHGPTWHHETGSATYVIRALQTLDAALSLSLTDATVAPGGSQDVTLTVDGAVLPGGVHTTRLVVTSNDPLAPTLDVPLTLTVAGVPHIVTTPDSLAFGEVYLGQGRARALRVRNLGTTPLTVSAVASSDAAFTVSPSAPLTIGVGASDTLFVAFQPVEAGPVSGTLTITSDDPATPVATVAFGGEGVAFPSIAVAPDSVSVALLAGESDTATLTLTNTGPGPLTYAVEGFTGHAPAADPDGFGYTWTDSRTPGGPAFEWVDISSTGTALAFGDDTWQDVDLPFLFPFYGDDKMVVRVASNGYLTFGSQRGDVWNARPIPSNWPPNDLIAPYWTNLDPAAGGKVYVGTDPAGRFVVQYDSVTTHSSPTWRTTFQVILDPGGNLLFQYLRRTAPFSGTIGIENADGTDGLQITHNSFPSFVTDSLAVRIDAPTPWLTMAEPATGTIAPGASAELTLSVDADSLEQGEYVAALRIASNDPDRPLVVVPVELEVSGMLRLPLAAGWNLVSWAVQPDDPAVGSVLAGVLDRVLAVETVVDGERRWFVPGQSGSTLTTFTPTGGYWIKMAAPALLEVAGTAVDRQHAIPLTAGDNVVSYLPWRTSGVDHALASVMDLTTSAASFHGTGLTYAPGVPDAFQVMDAMRSKAGYVLRTMAPGTLVYPVEPGGHTAGADDRPTLAGRLAAEAAAGVTPTMAWLDVWAADLRLGDGTALPLGTPVTARDAQGRVFGAFEVVADGRLGLLPVYADDPYTPEKDGALPGEMLTLHAGDEVLGAFEWTAAGDVHDLSGLIVSTGGQAEVPTAYDLAPNHPNPFHGATTLRFALPEASHVRLTVYDALGRLVATLVDEARPAGHHDATWDARALASGVYVTRMEAGTYRQSRRMLLVR